MYGLSVLLLICGLSAVVRGQGGPPAGPAAGQAAGPAAGPAMVMLGPGAALPGAGDSATTADPAAQQDRKCAADPPVDNRNECGELRTNEESCVKKGCCWDPLPDGVPGPWCFNFIPADDDAQSTVAVTNPEAEPTDAITADGDAPATAAAPVNAETTAAPDAATVTEDAAVHTAAEDVTTEAPGEDVTIIIHPVTTAEAGDAILTTEPIKSTVTEQKEQDTTVAEQPVTEEETTEAPQTTVPPKPTKPKDGKVLMLSTQLISNPPYLFEKSDVAANATGRDKYEGLVYDLLKLITDEMGTDFDIKIVDDGKYGTQNDDGSWTGMVGEVERGEAQIGGPLRVTTMREKAVDFTYPVDRFEAVMVFHKRHWNQEPKIESLEDLLSQDEVKYGVLNGGDIERYIAGSHDAELQQLHTGLKNMYKRDSNMEGVRRARSSSDYVFILEGIQAKMLEMKSPCDLSVLPTGFYHRQYAFAVPNKDALRDRFNHAMVDVKHSAEYQQVLDKWYGEDECADASGATLTATLLTLVLAASLSIFYN